MPPMKKTKVVLFLLDALRFDFLLKGDQPYQNRLTTIQQLMKQHPDKTRLFKFISDPPTTTSQRLKGLTCGSLPTFIDAGKNFDSDKLRADNWVSQLIRHQKSLVMLGDDTWKNLFEFEEFSRSRLYPAFNVHDLHTVDDGILRFLEPELRQDVSELKTLYQRDREFGHEKNFEKWDMLVAHFLGLDHAGHKYGVFHEKMYAKIDQMNQVLLNVSKYIDKDTMLILMSDHGMLDNGNHGGDSELEVDSVLFVFAPGMTFPEQKNVNIPQIDFVPTISYLMGVPIPFGSLGKMIFDLIPVKELETALSLNFNQINRYFTEYSSHDASFRDLISQNVIGKSQSEILQHLAKVSQVCRERWATFDVTSMMVGCCLLFLGIMFLFFTLDKMEPFPAIIHLLYSVSLFSNSFIVYEDRMILFFLQSLLMYQWYKTNNFKWIALTILLRFSTSHINYRSHGTHLIEIMPLQWSYFVIYGSMALILLLISLKFKKPMFTLLNTILILTYWTIREKFSDKFDFFQGLPLILYLFGVIMMIYNVFYLQGSFSDTYSILIFIFVILRGYEHVVIFVFLVIICISMENDNLTFAYTLITHFIGSYFYFVFGQQNTFNTINWNAAFVGFQETNAISGILIVGNLLAAQILCTIYFSNNIANFLYIRSLPMLATMILVMIERRHLMVWSIFAPKYIFAVVSFCVEVILAISIHLGKKYLK